MSVDQAIEGPITQLRTMLGADGYEVEWRATGPDSIALQVVAGADACEDCLVPKSVMQSIVGQLLEPAGLTASDIAYPGEAAA